MYKLTNIGLGFPWAPHGRSKGQKAPNLSQAYFANFGAFRSWEPKTNISQFVCVLCNPGCYIPIPSHLSFNNLDFSGYNKI
jgi:hypothetical protein